MDDHETKARNFQILNQRYFEPYARFIEIGGADGVSQVMSDDDSELLKFRFPDRYLAEPKKRDFLLTLHEMGHFVTVPERRCLTTGFGLSGGYPDLNFSHGSKIG